MSVNIYCSYVLQVFHVRQIGMNFTVSGWFQSLFSPVFPPPAPPSCLSDSVTQHGTDRLVSAQALSSRPAARLADRMPYLI